MSDQKPRRRHNGNPRRHNGNPRRPPHLHTPIAPEVHKPQALEKLGGPPTDAVLQVEGVRQNIGRGEMHQSNGMTASSPGSIDENDDPEQGAELSESLLVFPPSVARSVPDDAISGTQTEMSMASRSPGNGAVNGTDRPQQTSRTSSKVTKDAGRAAAKDEKRARHQGHTRLGKYATKEESDSSGLVQIDASGSGLTLQQRGPVSQSPQPSPSTHDAVCLTYSALPSTPVTPVHDAGNSFSPSVCASKASRRSFSTELEWSYTDPAIRGMGHASPNHLTLGQLHHLQASEKYGDSEYEDGNYTLSSGEGMGARISWASSDTHYQ